ncbi:MAG: pyridoxamine 5'-phosphate oxidase family protein [Lachnospiraceae bacterium]
MRRKDREVKEKSELLEIINRCKVCRIAMEDSKGLYIVPLNFGYIYEDDRLELVFHSAKEGRKIDILKEHPKVCFEMDCEEQLVRAEKPCEYSYLYQSIIGNGQVEFVQDSKEKERAMTALMRHQSGQTYVFDEKMLSMVVVFKIIVCELSGKIHQ